jgi:hypothetical protein
MMNQHDKEIETSKALEEGDDVLPGETLAQAWRRGCKMRQTKSAGLNLEAKPRNLALLGRALWILLHGEEYPISKQWSSRPPAPKYSDLPSAKSSATILLAGLERSLAKEDDPVVKDWLGPWSESPVKIVSASADEWGRLLDEITQPQSPSRPIAPSEIIP